MYTYNYESKIDSRPRVTVVGGGLVGSLTSIYFAKRGWKVSLFESRQDPRVQENQYDISHRSINLALSVRGINALKKADPGLEELVLKSAIPMKGRMIHIGRGKLKSQAYSIFGECIYSVERAELLKILLNTTKKFPNVEIFFGHKLKKCDFKAGILEFEREDGSEYNFENADLIIGTDGVHSVVRRQLMRVVRMNFQQEYISHAYLELTIPPKINEDGESEFAMDPNHLHIWPRHTFMFIALPNRNKSFTCTIFMPRENFEAIKTEDDLMTFFQEYFSDAVPLIGEENLKKLTEHFKNFEENNKGDLVSIKCTPYHFQSRAVILGDAAHCMVPFYGQGMNCGFQDVEILNNMLDKFQVDTASNFDKQFRSRLANALSNYTEYRHVDAIAICDLAMYNYIEMRSGVVSPIYLIRKKFEGWLHLLFPNTVIPLYTMVSFSTVRYSEALQRWKNQGFWLGVLGASTTFTMAVGAVWLGFRYGHNVRGALSEIFGKKL